MRSKVNVKSQTHYHTRVVGACWFPLEHVPSLPSRCVRHVYGRLHRTRPLVSVLQVHRDVQQFSWRRAAVMSCTTSWGAAHPALLQHRCVSHHRSGREEKEEDDGGAGSVAPAVSPSAPSTPTQRRFANRRGPAKRASPTHPSTDDNGSSTGTLRADAASRFSGGCVRPPAASSQHTPQTTPCRATGDDARLTSSQLHSSLPHNARTSPNPTPSVPPQPSTAASTANPVEDPVFLSGVRDVPDAATATSASLCSYLLTTRRTLSQLRSETVNRAPGAIGTAHTFFHFQMPLLMQAPPGESVTTSHKAAAGTTAEVSDEDGAAATEKATHRASGLPDSDEHLWGRGRVPWTTELAQSTLICCSFLGMTHAKSWVMRAAVTFLLHEARLARATTTTTTPSEKEGGRAQPAGAAVEQLIATCRFAVALLRDLQAVRRAERLTQEVLTPMALRVKLSNTAASQASRSDTDGASLQAPPQPLVDSMADVETYVHTYLLPSLFDELRWFCARMEQKYDAALATSSLLDTGATLREDCLHRASRPETDVFAALLSVLSQALQARCVRSSGDGWIAFATVAESAAAVPGVASTRWRVRQLPLRPYVIALSTIAATLRDTAGPASGLVERTMQRFRRNEGRRYVGPAHVEEDAAYRGWATRHRSPNVPVTQPAVPPPPSAGRFQQRHPSRSTTAQVPTRESTPASARHDGAIDRRTSGALQQQQQQKSVKTWHPNFNAQTLVLIMSFCFHDHTLQLLVDSTAAAQSGEKQPSTWTMPEQTRRLADAVSALAEAHWTLLEVALYWAPLCRTYQLPSVVNALSGAWRALPPSRTSSPLHAPHADGTAERASKTPPSPPLDRAVKEGVAALLLRSYPDPAALQSLVHHLLRASLRYADKQSATSFAANMSAFDALLSKWPPAVEVDDYCVPVGPGAPPQYPVLSATPAGAALLDEYVRTGWVDVEGVMFRGIMGARKAPDHDPQHGSRGKGQSDTTAIAVQRPYVVTCVKLQLSKVCSENGGGGGRLETGVAASLTPYTFYTAFFVEGWLRKPHNASFMLLTPDVVAKLLRTTERVANTLAMPCGGGRTSSALSLLTMWLCMPHVSAMLTGSETVLFMAQHIRLEVAALPLSALLLCHAERETANRGGSVAVASHGGNGALGRSQLQIVVLRQWIRRTSSHELYLTRDGLLLSRAAVAVKQRVTAAGGSPAFPPSQWSTLLTKEEAGDIVLVSRSLPFATNVIGAGWADAAFSLADITSLLRAVLLHNAVLSSCGEQGRETKVNPFICGAAVNEWLLRVAHRLLFAPLTRTDDDEDAQLAGDSAATLESLVALYLSLITAIDHAREVRVREAANTLHMKNEKVSRLLATNRARYAAGLQCSLARCEVVLRVRLADVAKPGATPWTVQSLLELSMILEEVVAGVGVDAAQEDTTVLHQQLVAHVRSELAAHLRTWSTHDIAVVLSNQSWWTTLRHRAAAAAAQPPLPPHLSRESWVEAALLDALEEREVAAWRLANTSSHTLPPVPLSKRPFATHEWVLLPFYARLEQRRASRAAQKLRSHTSVAAPAAADGPVDDFIELEATVSGEKYGSTAAITTAATTTTITAAGGSFAFDSLVVLERALSAIVAQCFSFDVFVQVVRSLLLSHPATLSTAPDTTSRHTTVGARNCLPCISVQWVAIPNSLRERFVDTLYRTFLRLVHLPTTTLEDILELLHVLWLADASLSPPSRTAAAAPASLRGRRSDRYTQAAAPSPPAWPSLFTRCAAFVTGALRVDPHPARHPDNKWQDNHQRDEDGSGAPRRGATPPALHTLCSTLQAEGMAQSVIYFGTSKEVGLSAAKLSSRTVLCFLNSLVTQVRAERGGGEEPPSLTSAQRVVLELLEPFMAYTIATAEALVYERRSTFLPYYLAAVSELDAAMVLRIIDVGYSQDGRRSHGARDAAPHRSKEPRFNVAATRRSARPTPQRRHSGGVERVERCARHFAAVVAAVLTVTGKPPTAAAAVERSGAVQRRHDATMAHLTMTGSAMDSLEETAPATGAVGAGQTRERAAAVVTTGAHRRAAYNLIAELHYLSLAPLPWNVLRYVDAESLHRLLLLRNVREHFRLSRRLRRLVLRTIWTEESGDGAAVTCSSISPTRAGLALRDVQQRLTPMGLQLLQCLPLPILRDFLHGHQCHRFHVPHMHRQHRAQLYDSSERSKQRRRSAMPVSVVSEVLEPAPLSAAGVADDDDVAQKSSAQKPGLKKGPSLAGALLLLDAAAARRVAAEVLAPTALLVLTADLTQLLWWGRDASEAPTSSDPATAPSPHASVHRPPAPPCTPSSSTVTPSYAVLLRCASAGSVLREPTLQPYLMAACAVLDELSSEREDDFFAVLSRDAVWRRAVKDGAAVLRGGGDGGTTTTTTTTTAVLQEGDDGEDDAVGAATPDDDEWESDISGVTSVDGEETRGSHTSASAATRRAGEPVVVLDWKPIVRLLHVMYRVDPGLRAWLEREGALGMRSSSFPEPVALSRGRRDFFLNGLESMVRRVSDVWRRASPDTAADSKSTSPVLLMVNIGAALHFSSPYRSSDAAAAVRALRASSAPQRVSMDRAEWLAAGTASGEVHAGVDGGCCLTARDSRLYPVSFTVRPTTTEWVPIPGVEKSWRTVMARRARHAALLQRAGLRRPASDAGEQGCGTAKWAGGASADGAVDVDGYWRLRQSDLQRRVVEAVFPPTPQDDHVTTAAVTMRAAADAAESEAEREAWTRLELMRCGDVAQLLHVLLAHPEPEGGTAATARVHALRLRVLLQSLHELLPSAAPAEVVSVVEGLLNDFVSLSVTQSQVSAAAAPLAASSHRDSLFEVRRLLSSVGVLLANDVERFSTGQLVWLLTRLHTPQLQGSAQHSDAPTAVRASRDVRDAAALDVSRSFLSAAVARSLAMELGQGSAASTDDVTPLPSDGDSGITAPVRGVVTFSQWMAAVSAAEAHPCVETVKAVLAIIEATAL